LPSDWLERPSEEA